MISSMWLKRLWQLEVGIFTLSKARHLQTSSVHNSKDNGVRGPVKVEGMAPKADIASAFIW